MTWSVTGCGDDGEEVEQFVLAGDELGLSARNRVRGSRLHLSCCPAFVFYAAAILAHVWRGGLAELLAFVQ